MSLSPPSPVCIDLAHLVALRSAPGPATPLRPRRTASQSGNYLSRFRGRGMEFAEVRAYQPGDDVRSIDWRVTARRGTVHTKLFHEEREQPVLFALDYRRPMFFATRGRFKAVLASELAAILAWHAQARGDRVGGLFFSDDHDFEVRPAGGRRGVLRLLRQMAGDPVWQRPLHAPFAPQQSLARTIQRLRQVTRPGSLVHLFSDFNQWDAAVEKELGLLARHAQLVLYFLYDPLESELPRAGNYRLSDGERDLTIATAAGEVRSQYRQHFLAHRQELEVFCQRYRVRFVAITTEEEPQSALQPLLRTGSRRHARQ